MFPYKNVVSTVPWTALGYCGKEDPSILHNQLQAEFGNDNNTHQNCIDMCDQGGYAYAGVENGRGCWCDNTINPPGALAPDGVASCDLLYTGKSDENRGGDARLDGFIKSMSI